MMSEIVNLVLGLIIVVMFYYHYIKDRKQKEEIKNLYEENKKNMNQEYKMKINQKVGKIGGINYRLEYIKLKTENEKLNKENNEYLRDMKIMDETDDNLVSEIKELKKENKILCSKVEYSERVRNIFLVEELKRIGIYNPFGMKDNSGCYDDMERDYILEILKLPDEERVKILNKRKEELKKICGTLSTKHYIEEFRKDVKEFENIINLIEDCENMFQFRFNRLYDELCDKEDDEYLRDMKIEEQKEEIKELNKELELCYETEKKREEELVKEFGDPKYANVELPEMIQKLIKEDKEHKERMEEVNKIMLNQIPIPIPGSMKAYLNGKLIPTYDHKFNKN